MTSRVVLVVVALLTGAILGLESLGRIIGNLPRVAGWQAVIGIVIIVVGTWSLDRLLHALVGLTDGLLRPVDQRAESLRNVPANRRRNRDGSSGGKTL